MQMWAAIGGALVLFAVLQAGESTICFQCKSWEDPGCWNVKQNETNSTYAKFCDDDNIPAGVAPFCRTIRQKIKDGNGTDRLWRKCGWEEHKTKDGLRNPKSCYYFSDGHHEEAVCQCFFDYCNGAGQRGASPAAVLAALGVSALAALAARSATS